MSSRGSGSGTAALPRLLLAALLLPRGSAWRERRTQSGGGAKLLADGAPCADPAECTSTFCAGGQCTSGAAGQTCDDAVVCADDLPCLNLRCWAPLPDDAACADPAECASTFCADGRCTSGAAGQTCDDAVACADGLLCLDLRCSAPLPDGEGCEDSAHCESTFCANWQCTSGFEGQTCDDVAACADGLVCIAALCEPPREDDERCLDPTHCASTFCANFLCTSGAEGQTCDDAAPCEAGLNCMSDSRCKAPFPDGEYCWDAVHCESTFCVTGFCTSGLVNQLCLEGGTCATEDLYCLGKCLAKLADGEPCAGQSERCLSGNCLPAPGNYYCSAATGVGDIPDAEPCTNDAQCTSLICIQNKCSPPLADGESCDLGTHCESTSCVQRECTSGAEGQTCNADVVCADGTVCINSKCVPLLADGESCQDDTHCESTFCVSGQCTIGAEGQTCDDTIACETGLVCILPKCVAPLPDGAYCFDTTQCESGTCDTGFCGVPYWMLEEIARNYEVDEGANEDLVDVSKSPDIRYGFTSGVPSSMESNYFTELTPPKDSASLARWIVHDALWATVSAGGGDLNNPRSTTDGASMASSNGRPVFNVPNVDISFNPTKASKEVKLSFRKRGTCGNMCAEVLMYGEAVRLIENTPEFVAALASFKATHPMAKWLWKGGARTSKYYTVVPTRILIHASPGDSAVSVGITEYLGVVFEAEGEEETDVIDSESFASQSWNTSSMAWYMTITLHVITSLLMVYHTAD